MMCDTVNRSFRAQLAAILDKLTKAALLEIGSLADECSAVLHTEISQHKTENEALKKRCYSLEVQLRAAREAHGYRPQTAGQTFFSMSTAAMLTLEFTFVLELCSYSQM